MDVEYVKNMWWYIHGIGIGHYYCRPWLALLKPLLAWPGAKRHASCTFGALGPHNINLPDFVWPPLLNRELVGRVEIDEANIKFNMWQCRPSLQKSCRAAFSLLLTMCLANRILRISWKFDRKLDKMKLYILIRNVEDYFRYSNIFWTWNEKCLHFNLNFLASSRNFCSNYRLHQSF